MSRTRLLQVCAAGTMAALLAGCARMPGATTGGTNRNGVAYAACMRSHGVPDFPDAKHGGFNVSTSPRSTVANGVALKETQSQITTANQTCNHYLGTPANAGPASPQRQQAALAFAQCMRSHGFPHFPDPQVTANSFRIRVPPGINANSPPFQAALQTCQRLVPIPGGPKGAAS